MELLFQQTPRGATYLQAGILVAILVIIALPAAYVIIRDASRSIREWRKARRIRARFEEMERRLKER